jgi:hypothetical protein
MSPVQVEREGEAEEGKRCSNGNRQHDAYLKTNSLVSETNHKKPTSE